MVLSKNEIRKKNDNMEIQLSEAKLKEIIKGVLFEDRNVLDNSFRDWDNDPYIYLNQNNVNTNKIFIHQWGENGGFTIDLNKARKVWNGWMIPAPGKFRQTYHIESDAQTYWYSCVFVKKGNGQMLYGGHADGSYDSQCGVGLKNGYIYVDKSGALKIALNIK